MRLGTVSGSIVSTVKHESLKGSKLLVVDIDGGSGEPIVAVDLVGAGTGERVLVATGGAARVAAEEPTSAVDAAVVAIVDQMSAGS